MPLTLAQMLALFPDNTSGDISEADARDAITGLYELDRRTAPIDGDFSWVNQNSAVLDVNEAGHISIIAPHNAAGSLSCRVKTAPATPYTVSARLRFALPAKNSQSAGLLFRESGTAELVIFAASYDGSGGLEILSVSHWTSPTSFSASVFTQHWAGRPDWMRIADDGTNRRYSVSADGENWIEVYNEGRTVFLTANQTGFMVNAQNGSAPNLSGQMVVESWDEG